MPITQVKLFCAAFIVPLMAIGLYSCKKETSCEGCKENNKPPITLAGPDQVITLPTDSVLLDGSSSSDPDGIISSYLSTKISGPLLLTSLNQRGYLPYTLLSNHVWTLEF